MHLYKAKRAEQDEGIVIRVGSSLLNPSKVLTDLWAPLRATYPQYKFHMAFLYAKEPSPEVSRFLQILKDSLPG